MKQGSSTFARFCGKLNMAERFSLCLDTFCCHQQCATCNQEMSSEPLLEGLQRLLALAAPHTFSELAVFRVWSPQCSHAADRNSAPRRFPPGAAVTFAAFEALRVPTSSASICSSSAIFTCGHETQDSRGSRGFTTVPHLCGARLPCAVCATVRSLTLLGSDLGAVKC